MQLCTVVVCGDLLCLLQKGSEQCSTCVGLKTLTVKHNLSLADDVDLGSPRSSLCPQQPVQGKDELSSAGIYV